MEIPEMATTGCRSIAIHWEIEHKNDRQKRSRAARNETASD